MDSTFDGLPEPMSGQRGDFFGVSATELEDARERREKEPEEGKPMHEVRFVGNYSGAIVEEPTYDNGVFECGGDVRIFALSDVSCFTAMECGDYRVTLRGGEVFYVTKGDFERLVSNTFCFNFRVDDPWN